MSILIRRAATNFIWRVGVFLMIFAPILNLGVGALADTLSLLCVFLIIYGLMKSKVILLPEVRNLAVLLVATITYGIIAGLLASSELGSFQVALRPLRALLMFGGLYIFVLLYAKRDGNRFSEALIYDVFIAISIHALLMVVQFVFPEVRNAMYPYTFADQVIEFNQQFRMAGLTNGGGAQLSIFQAVGLLLSPLVLLNQKDIGHRIFVILLTICIFVSLLLCGRSGLVLALVMLPAVLYFSRKNGGVAIVIWSGEMMLGSFVVIGAVYAASLAVDLSLDNWAYAEQAFNRSLDFILGDDVLLNHEGVGDLGRMSFFPEDIKTLLWGNSYLFEASYWGERRIVDSDIGYVIFMFGYGFFGSLVQYAFYGLIIWYSIRGMRYNRSLALISLIWAVSVLAFHAKEVLVFSRIGFSFTVIFMVALAIERGKKMRRLA